MIIITILVGAVVCAGCVQAPATKYERGDLLILDTELKWVAIIVLRYDEATDEYLITHAGRDERGRWTHLIIGDERWIERALVDEKMHKIGHVNPDNLVPLLQLDR